ncbi:MAG TPA: hypothetical protein DCE23_07490 [Firmicutes bacterium]|nr:hypothetical protein [Bacillota bacterium]
MGKKKNQQISNDKEIINFGKLKEAQKTAEKEELELTKGMMSVLCGQELYFVGVMGNITNMTVRDKCVKRFYLYYSSFTKFDTYEKDRIIFRKMLCQCNKGVFDKFYNEIKNKNESANDYNKISKQISVSGTFTLIDSKPLFELTEIEVYLNYKYNNVYIGLGKELPDFPFKNFNYDIFFDLIKKIEALKCANETSLHDRIKHMGEYYNMYIETFKSLQSKKDYKELMRMQFIELNRLYDSIKAVCNNADFDYYGCKYNGNKMVKIINDMAMMHTSIHSNDYDQLGVLYDNTCLRAMYEASILVKSLILFDIELQDSDDINNKQIILVLLIYFRKFYMDYIKFIKLPISAVSAYNHYMLEVKNMINDLGFDSNRETYFYKEMKTFILYIKKLI